MHAPSYVSKSPFLPAHASDFGCCSVSALSAEKYGENLPEMVRGDVIEVYIKTIKALRLVDPRGLLLEGVRRSQEDWEIALSLQIA